MWDNIKCLELRCHLLYFMVICLLVVDITYDINWLNIIFISRVNNFIWLFILLGIFRLILFLFFLDFLFTFLWINPDVRRWRFVSVYFLNLLILDYLTLLFWHPLHTIFFSYFFRFLLDHRYRLFHYHRLLR